MKKFVLVCDDGSSKGLACENGLVEIIDGKVDMQQVRDEGGAEFYSSVVEAQQSIRGVSMVLLSAMGGDYESATVDNFYVYLAEMDTANNIVNITRWA